MSIIFEVFPLLAFFIAYQLSGIFMATMVAIALSALQVLYFLLRKRKPPMMLWLTLVLVGVFGGATLWLQNDLFIKLKSTLVYWCVATGFLLTHKGPKPLISRLLEQGAPTLQLPRTIIQQLNLRWAGFMFLLGVINLFVLYYCDTKTWVNYKLFGALGLLFVFVLFTAWSVQKHLSQQEIVTDGNILENS